jgi:hypothetical protein
MIKESTDICPSGDYETLIPPIQGIIGQMTAVALGFEHHDATLAGTAHDENQISRKAQSVFFDCRYKNNLVKKVVK